MIPVLFLMACASSITVGNDTGSGDGGDTDTAGDTGGDTDSGDTDSDSGDTDTGGGVDPDAPTCAIASPADGFAQTYDLAFTFVAAATDPQDGAVPGTRIAWTTSAGGTSLGTGTNITVTLAASGAQTITCTATDADEKTGTDSIVVTSISPVVEIWHPGDGEVREAGSDIPWVGKGNDLEDGALTGDSLGWSSSIDGAFGTGESFYAPLSVCSHVITLTGTDSEGNSSTATLALTIE